MKKQLLTFLGIIGLGTMVAQTTLLSENFSSQSLPLGWTNDSLGNNATMLWTFGNPGSRTITGANFDANFIILDSDFDGSGKSQNASLTTSSFSTIGFTQVNLVFSEVFRYYLPSTNDISFSTNGGTTWTMVRHDSTNIGYPNPAIQTTLILPAGAVNKANVKIKFTYVGSWGYYWALDNIKVSGLNNCTGTPTAGTVSGAPSSICANVPYTMTLSGASMNIGTTYQWMSSTNGVTYNPISGATGTNFTDSVSIPVYYEVVVTCSNSALSATTPPVSVSISPLSQCFCVPSQPDCAGGFIYRVSITGTTLNNNDSACINANNGAYTKYPASGNTTASLVQGATYSFNITTNENDILSLWIDYNHNGVFETNEWKQITISSSIGVVDIANITIPSGALPGLTGMRIRSRMSGNPNDSTSACDVFGSGETEDYFVTIVIMTGINENTIGAFNLFPNPANDFVSLTLNNNGTETFISITDLVGNTVLNNIVSHDSNVNLNISELKNGVYMVGIHNKNGNSVKRLVISR